MKNVSIFSSGWGANALNLVKESKRFPNIYLTSVLVDEESSPLPYKLKESNPGLKVHTIFANLNLKGKERKREHEIRILELLKREKVDWILLAGYMPIIGQTMLEVYKGRIINIHPSLLPDYKGVNSYKRSFEDKVPFGGVSIHFVDEGIDTGPLILQEKFPRLETDTLTDYVQRGKNIELSLFPKILQMINDSTL